MDLAVRQAAKQWEITQKVIKKVRLWSCPRLLAVWSVANVLLSHALDCAWECLLSNQSPPRATDEGYALQEEGGECGRGRGPRCQALSEPRARMHGAAHAPNRQRAARQHFSWRVVCVEDMSILVRAAVRGAAVCRGGDCCESRRSWEHHHARRPAKQEQICGRTATGCKRTTDSADSGGYRARRRFPSRSSASCSGAAFVATRRRRAAGGRAAAVAPAACRLPAIIAPAQFRQDERRGDSSNICCYSLPAPLISLCSSADDPGPVF